jgi:hypothetical protein
LLVAFQQKRRPEFLLFSHDEVETARVLGGDGSRGSIHVGALHSLATRDCADMLAR